MKDKEYFVKSLSYIAYLPYTLRTPTHITVYEEMIILFPTGSPVTFFLSYVPLERRLTLFPCIFLYQGSRSEKSDDETKSRRSTMMLQGGGFFFCRESKLRTIQASRIESISLITLIQATYIESNDSLSIFFFIPHPPPDFLRNRSIQGKIIC